MIPRGIILVWSGAIIDIPAGWILCDGNGGSPDLRNKFLVGAGDTYCPGDQGGSFTHDHTFTGDGHSHLLPPGAGLASGVGVSAIINPTAVTGTTDEENAPPPYYALAFIFKE